MADNMSQENRQDTDDVSSAPTATRPQSLTPQKVDKQIDSMQAGTSAAPAAASLDSTGTDRSSYACQYCDDVLGSLRDVFRHEISKHMFEILGVEQGDDNELLDSPESEKSFNQFIAMRERLWIDTSTPPASEHAEDSDAAGTERSESTSPSDERSSPEAEQHSQSSPSDNTSSHNSPDDGVVQEENITSSNEVPVAATSGRASSNVSNHDEDISTTNNADVTPRSVTADVTQQGAHTVNDDASAQVSSSQGVPPQDTRQYKCPICGRICITNALMTTHILWHIRGNLIDVIAPS